MHIVEGEHRVDLRLMSDVVRLGLFGNAGADENYLRIVPVGFFEQAAVRDHGADDRGQIGDQLGVIFLHQVVDGGAAGGDDILHLMRFDELVVFSRDVGRAVRRLRRAENAEPLEGAQKLSLIVKIKGSVVGGGEGEDYALAVFQKSLYLVEIARKRFGVLRAGVEALAAENTVRLNDLRLLACQPDGFDRADLDAFITVFTVCLLQADDAHLDGSFLAGRLGQLF